MKKLILLSVALPLLAMSYPQIIHKVDNSLALKRAKKMVEASREMAKAAQGKNLPSLEASLQAIDLKDTPTMYLHLPRTPVTALPMGKKEQWQGELRLSYPLFSGFAITAATHKAAIAYQKAKLQQKALKRNLYIQTTQLYTTIYSLQIKLQALQKGKKAIIQAYKKAKGLFDKGFLAPSELYAIEAKRYEIEASIAQTKGAIASFYNNLSFLLHSKVDSIDTLWQLPEPKKDKIIQSAMHTRADLLALQKALQIDKADIKLAKSAFYPKIALFAALKRHGDSLKLNGDGFTNADQSYIGAALQWNLFAGFANTHALQAAKLKRLATLTQLQQYKNQITITIKNAFLKLAALQKRRQSAHAEVKAREEYYKLTLGRFENQLASADELSRTIADLAAARAKEAATEAAIFNQKAYIYLLGGLESFQKVVNR